jgi:hypothetical protein
MNVTSLTARTIRDNDCLIWQGAVQSSGYGSVTAGKRGKSMLVHRKVWELVNGPIPDGLTIDHLCFVKLCINVEHMEVVTRSENSLRAVRVITHCKRGHELSGDNLRLSLRKTGRVHRVCRACARAYNQEWMRAARLVSEAQA